MNRLHGWAVVCVVAALALAASASADGSWVGKRVMPKKAGLTISHTNDQGRDVEVAKLDAMFYTVELGLQQPGLVAGDLPGREAPRQQEGGRVCKTGV